MERSKCKCEDNCGRDDCSPGDVFNYFQSNSRITIERAFGVLVQRFGVLWRPMRIAHRHVQKIVKLCMIFHNIAIDHNQKLMGRCAEPGWEDKGRFTMHLQEQFVEGRLIDTVIPLDLMTPGRRREREASDTREKITKALHDNRRNRPGHSNYGKTTNSTMRRNN
jgi:hypothetical protein